MNNPFRNSLPENIRKDMELAETQRKLDDCEEGWGIVEAIAMTLRGEIDDLIKVVQARTKK